MIARALGSLGRWCLYLGEADFVDFLLAGGVCLEWRYCKGWDVYCSQFVV